jgi:nucleoside-diphosphate-sugar epimerase
LHDNGNSVVGVMRNNRNADNLLRRGIMCINYNDLPDVLSRTDCFVHCAGKTGFYGRWEDYEKINVQWTLSLFNLVKKYRLGCFIYISSVAALGYANRVDEHELNEETEPLLHAQEFYGRSKLMAEEQLTQLAHNTGTRLVILRPGLIYGKRKTNTDQSWLRRGTIVDPDSVIPLIHIDNFVDAIKKVSLTQEANGVFLAVDDEQPTQKELNTLKKELGLIKYNPWIIGLKIFYFHLRFKQILKHALKRNNLYPQPSIEPLVRFHSRRMRYSCYRLKKVTNWKPHVTLEEGWR